SAAETIWRASSPRRKAVREDPGRRDPDGFGRRGGGEPGRGRTADRRGRGAGRAPCRAAGELLPHRPPRGRQGEGARARRTRADPGFPCRSGAPARTVASRRHGAARVRGRGPDTQRVAPLRRRRPARGALRQDAPLPLRRRRQRALRRSAHARARRCGGGGAEPVRAACAFRLLRCALSRAVPIARRVRPHVRALGFHRAHRAGALGHPAARARRREPGLPHRTGPGRPARERPPHLRPYDDRRSLGRSAGGARRGRGRGARRDRQRQAARGARLAARPRQQETELNLDTAKTTLLAPHDLETAKLERVFGTLAAHKVDYADLYFQYSRYEGWSLEEGIVKSGSFNFEQGVGVRAVSGEKTAFAYSDEISFDALQDAAKATRAIASSGKSHKVKLLEKLERKCRALDPRITQVIASLGGEYEVVLIARADGTLAADVRPLVRLSVQVIAEANGRRESGSGGGGGRTDYAHFTDEVLDEYARHAVSQALVNL